MVRGASGWKLRARLGPGFTSLASSLHALLHRTEFTALAALSFSFGYMLDNMTTVVFIRYHGATETNPLVALAIAELGLVPGVFLTKLLLVPGALLITYWLMEDAQAAFSTAAFFASLPWIAAGVWNLYEAGAI